ERSYERIVREYLHWAGVNRLTGLVLTHGDSQHIGGVTQLLSDFPRVHVIDNSAPDRSLIHRRLSRRMSGLEGRERKSSELAADDNFHLSRDTMLMFCSRPAGLQDQQRTIKLWLFGCRSRRAHPFCLCRTTAQKPRPPY